MDNWRVAVLGDGGVGKTALAVQFTLNCFVETYDPTIEDAYRKQLVVDNRMCFVEVIDTAGQEEYATLRDQWRGPRFHSRLLDCLPIDFRSARNISSVYAKGQTRRPHIHARW